MSVLLAVAATVAATPVPTPSPVVVQQIVTKVQEVPVTPEYINQLLFAGALLAAGWIGSAIQSFIKSRKDLSQRVNVLITAFYTIAGAAVVLYQQGQLDLSNWQTMLSSAGVVLLAAWVRHNGGKLLAPATAVPVTSDEPLDVVLPRKATV